MMQFHLSKTLARELALHVQPSAEITPSALQWYGHSVIVAKRKCVIMMEKESRYAMAFCGMKKRDFEDFPALFQDRLVREVSIITQLESPLPESDLALLSDLVLDIAAEEVFQAGSDRSVTSHIKQVKQHLEMMIYGEGYPLPATADEAFHFGLVTNDVLRKRQSDKDYFYPIRVFHDFWTGLLRCTKDAMDKADAAHSTGKVIYAEFGKTN